MNRLLFFLFIIFSFTYNSQGATVTSAGAGDWGTISWTGGTPQAGDDIVIEHAVTYDSSSGLVYKSLTIQNNGSLTISSSQSFDQTKDVDLVSGSLILEASATHTFSGDITVNSGANISLASGSRLRMDQKGSATITIFGDVTVNNGSIDLISSATGNIDINSTATVSFTGTSTCYLQGGSTANYDILGTVSFSDNSQLISNKSGGKTTLVITGALIFDDGTSLYQGDPTKLSITGAVTFRTQLSNGGKWRHVAPFFSSGTTWNDLSSTDFKPTVSQGSENIYYWDASSSNSNDYAIGWDSVTNLSSAGFESGSQAYSVYSGDGAFSYSNGGLVSVTLNTATLASHTCTLYNTFDPNASYVIQNEGWNLVPNPFPTWLDLDAVLTGEMTGGTMLDYQGAHIWDASAGNYKAYLVSGETLESHENGLTNGSTGSRYIQPWQAFWLKLEDDDSATNHNNLQSGYRITIETSYRTTTPATTTYFKKGSSVNNRIRLDIFSLEDSSWDQVLLASDPLSHSGFKGGEDAYDKVAGGQIPNLYFKLSDGRSLCINTMPFGSSEIIPLYFDYGKTSASYSISLDQLDLEKGFVKLEDLKMNMTWDLTNGAYVFQHDPDFGAHRFNILYNEEPNGVEEEITKSFNAWFAGNEIYLQNEDSPLTGRYTLMLYSATGQKIANYSLDSHQNKVFAPGIANGVYIIELWNASIKIGTKKLVKWQ